MENKLEKIEEETSTTNERKLWGDLSPDIKPKKPEFEILESKIFRVTPQRPLQTHIEGFTEIKMVMYVQRVDFIVDLFDLLLDYLIYILIYILMFWGLFQE